MTVPRFKTAKFKGHRKDIRAAAKKIGASERELALRYESLWKDCSSLDEFNSFLADAADGAGLHGALIAKAKKMVDALQVIRQRHIWSRFGWAGNGPGVHYIYSIPNPSERKKVVSEIVARLGGNGNGKLTGEGLKQIVRDLAPSKEVKDSVQRGNDKDETIRTLELEKACLVKNIKAVRRANPSMVNQILDDACREIMAQTIARRRRA